MLNFDLLTEGLFQTSDEANKYKQSLKSKISKLQRWDHWHEYTDADMVKDSNGEFIKFEDLMKAIQEW